MITWQLVQALLVLLIPSIASWLMEASANVATSFISEDLTTFSADGNLLKSFETVLNGSGFSIGVNLPQIILAISFVLIILFTLFSVINSMISALEGESAESPIKVLLRALITVVMEVAIFGLPSLHTASNWFVVGGGGGLLSALGQIASKILALISPTAFKMDASFGAGLTGLGIANAIVYVILCLSVFTGVISASIVFIERYLTFGLYILIGPLAVATNTSKSTERTFHDWLTGLLSNFISLFISILGFRLFLNSLKSVLEVKELTISSETLFKFAVSIALMSLITNSEKIANAFGFRTIANGDTARSIAAGTRLASRAFMMTGGKAIAGGINHINNRATQSRAINATKAFGPNSAISKGMNYLNNARNGSVPLNSKYNMAGTNVKAGEGGRIENVANKIGDRGFAANFTSKQRRMEAIENTNNAMYDSNGNVQIGNRVAMKDAVIGMGTENNTGFRTKEFGTVVQAPDGTGAIMFDAELQNDKGEWEQKTMMFTPSNSHFDVGDGITTTANGAQGYSIKQGEMYSLGNDSMQMVEVSKNGAINADQFNAMPNEITDNFADHDSYNTQVQESIHNINAQISEGDYYSSLESSGAYFHADNDGAYEDSSNYVDNYNAEMGAQREYQKEYIENHETYAPVRDENNNETGETVYGYSKEEHYGFNPDSAEYNSPETASNYEPEENYIHNVSDQYHDQIKGEGNYHYGKGDVVQDDSSADNELAAQERELNR